MESKFLENQNYGRFSMQSLLTIAPEPQRQQSTRQDFLHSYL